MTVSNDAVQQIGALARSGRLDQAALMAAGAFARMPEDPVLAALAGAVEFHRGQFARAIDYLQVAHRARPGDITIRSNLVESLFRCGRGLEALGLCDAASIEADQSWRLARLAAHLAQELEDYPRAVQLYRRISDRFPDDWSVWNNLGNALSAAGEFQAATEALARAVNLAPDSQPIRINLGNALIEAGRLDEAEQVFAKAAADRTDDAMPLLPLFALYRAQGRDDDAYATIAEAARRAPDNAEVWSDYGQEAARRNEYALAETAFNRALTVDPGLGPVFVGLASVFERMNRDDELDPLRERAVASGVDDEPIAYIDALRFKRLNRFEEAFVALERSGDAVQPGRRFHLRGTLLERLGRHDEAFDAFTAMNRHWLEDPSQPGLRAKQYRDAVIDATALLSPEWIANWTEFAPADGRRTPIFLVGFPRSGTTLLDTMLMADPQVRVLEEEPFIGEIERELGGLDAIGQLDAAALQRARASYFEKVAQLGELDSNAIVVDKHPLHLNKVSVIRRLFPDARFILALRHPCDVLLSCFITNFNINNAMANFLDLNDAAALYDMTFAHWEKARSIFDLPVSTIVYERLVEDPERELRPLFAQIGLAWPEGQLDHRKAARARGTVSTASYSQVVEPIYKRAAGRWQRYAHHLEPILPMLAPWVERLGYSLEDDRTPPWPATHRY